MYVYMYLCIHVRMYLCICVYECIYVRTYVCMCVCMCVCVCTYVCTYIYTYVHTYICWTMNSEFYIHLSILCTVQHSCLPLVKRVNSCIVWLCMYCIYPTYVHTCVCTYIVFVCSYTYMFPNLNLLYCVSYSPTHNSDSVTCRVHIRLSSWQ